MKTVILCGGLGTRLSEETQVKPKPMVEIGGMPILWHIMKIYAAQGFRDFVLALGYKGETIKDFFLNYRTRQSDLLLDLKSGRFEISEDRDSVEDWTIHLVDTGLSTLTGGRLGRLRNHLIQEQKFLLTYGDGLANVDVKALVGFHEKHGRLATVTAVRPPARFGNIVFDGDRVTEFKEKPQTGEGWINGGFFVFERGVFDYLHGDDTVLEGTPLEKLAEDGQLMAYRHHGFWQPMDTLRDKNSLEGTWCSGKAPWRIWQDHGLG
jgi:glucose-1-phosphate cytidylyltransferase